MPLFGAHMSIAGGCHNALLDAYKHECGSVQLFTKNNNQWQARPLDDEALGLFRRTLRETKLRHPTAHTSYLINLASPQEALFRKSIEALVDEMNRAEQLGLSYLVLHPGSPVDSSEEAGLARVIEGLDEVHRRCPEHRVRLLLETTAGQGSCLGHRFEHLAHLLEGVADAKWLGVCFDTCHVFAAGYPLVEKYEEVFTEFDRLIGISRLKVFHLNDSKKPLGSRVDRHAHLGQGHLGLEPFRRLVNDPRFRRHPMILETPKEEGDNKDMDTVNLRTLRELIK